jgi:hypothetical protein
MEIRIYVAPWLPFVLATFEELAAIGFALDDDDIALIVQDAVEAEVC